ncbi:hypothetical protein [Noviherbaspirillum autotrophicum]|nr:hypothetical protein [Noviherbaspirillum autotrophicum]
MPTQLRHRQAIVDYLGSISDFASARDIAVVLKIPYKTTIDALNALHAMGRVARVGRKFRAKWGAN